MVAWRRLKRVVRGGARAQAQAQGVWSSWQLDVVLQDATMDAAGGARRFRRA